MDKQTNRGTDNLIDSITFFKTSPFITATSPEQAEQYFAAKTPNILIWLACWPHSE